MGSRMRRFRVACTGVAAMVAMGSLAACGGVIRSDGGGGSTLRTLGFGLPDEIATVRVDRYREQNPDVDVQIVEGGFDAQQFLSSVASGNPPDLIYMDRQFIGTYAERGAIVSLDDCVESAGIVMDDFRPAAVEQVTYQDSVYGIPEFFNTRVVVLNDQALSDAGLTPDDVDTSDWDRLAQSTEQLTAMDGDNIVRLGFDPRMPEAFPMWARANGAQMLSDDGRTAQLEEPELLEALNYTVGLIQAQGGFGDIRAFRETWDFFGAENEFVADQVGGMPIENWYINVLAEVSPDAPISVAPFQDRDGRPLTQATGSAWAIPKGAANPDDACAFMQTMTATDTWVAAAEERVRIREEEGQLFTGVYTGNEAADDVIFTELWKPTGNEAMDEAVRANLEAQENAFAIPPSAAGAEFDKAWQDALLRVLNGQVSAKDAMARAQQEAQSALDRATSGA
jgi:multiple sugar transport system substrate-binding protein